MENTTEIRDLLQKAVDAICKSKKYEEEYMIIAQKLGLQGEKRRFRYESTMDHNFINFLRCDTFDVFGMSLKSEAQGISAPSITSISSFFTAVLEFLESKYNTLHTIANKLVTFNAQFAASKMYEKCRCIIEDIKYYRRTIMEGEATGWSAEFVFLHQTTECNIHDHFEEKEKEIGYPG